MLELVEAFHERLSVTQLGILVAICLLPLKAICLADLLTLVAQDHLLFRHQVAQTLSAASPF